MPFKSTKVFMRFSEFFFILYIDAENKPKEHDGSSEIWTFSIIRNFLCFLYNDLLLLLCMFGESKRRNEDMRKDRKRNKEKERGQKKERY